MSRTRVLIAGRNTSLRRRTRSLLDQEPGVEVVAEAESAGQALILAGELAPDVALIDADMPLGDSLEAVGRIARTCPDTSVLILSAWDRERFMLSTADIDQGAYLLRSVRGGDLGRAVRGLGLRTAAVLT